MSHAADAWMPFFGDDFLDDERVAAYSLADQMLYLRLIWRQWKHASLPDDSKLCAKLIGAPESAEAVTRLLEDFFAVESGRRVNVRCAAERDAAMARLAAASRNGKASAAARVAKADSQRPFNGRSTPVEQPLQGSSNGRSTLTGQDSTGEKRTEQNRIPEIPPTPSESPPTGASTKREPSLAQIAWNNAWAQHREGEYVWKQIDAAAVNKLGKDHGIEAVAVKADGMLRDLDKFVWANASPRLLSNRWNQIDQGAPKDDGSEAGWRSVRSAINTYSGNRDAPDMPRFADPRVALALEKIGGFRQFLGGLDAKEADFVRSRFAKAYGETRAAGVAQIASGA